MPLSPQLYMTYDEYEPQKYNCISVDDDLIKNILSDIESVDTYWHTLLRPSKGLAYYGVTLIAPLSLFKFKQIVDSQNYDCFLPLSQKIDEAIKSNSFIIHFGI